MGLLLNVYRNNSLDCTNNGISSRYDTVCVTNVEGPFEPSADHPEVVLETGPFNSVRLTPISLIESNSWYMFGGNYAGSCDSRFSDAVEKMCGYRHSMIKIFDRVE